MLQAQEPITSAGKSLISGACKMLEATKQLAINPKDPPSYQQYSNHSKNVSDAIKRLISAIRYRINGFFCGDFISAISAVY
jgi:talin